MYNHYPEELIEEIRTNNDIVDVVTEYVKLDKKGQYLFGLCPFHKEKTASFSVTPSKQIFYCYSCGKGGNVVNFVMNVENLEFIEAVRFLADRVKIQLPEGESKEEEEKAKLKQEILKINSESARFFYNYLSLKQGENARNYLRTRNLSENTIRKFGIGLSPDDWDLLYKHLINKGYDENIIIKSGLVLPNKKGGYYDRFRSRIIFPIFDIRGNVIGFGGRVTDASMPKYMNSPETPVYNKGKTLYAMNFAKNAGEKRIIVVEGYMDVISLHQCGIINTVASLGTALTESQGRVLKKYAEEIIISYDADTAGQTATMRGLDLLNDIGCNVKVLIVPKGKDPDEYVRNNGTEGFKKLINDTLPLVEYKVKVLKEQINTDTTEGEIKLRNGIVELLAKTDNHIEREMYVKKFSKEYSISEESLYGEINRRMKPRASYKKTIVNINDFKDRNIKNAGDNEDNKLGNYEKLLLALLCVDNSTYKNIKDMITVEDFTNDDNKRTAGFIFEKLANKKDIFTGELMNFLEGSAANDFARIINEECNCEDNNKAVLDIIKRIQFYKLEKRQKEILEILNNKSIQAEGDVEKLKLELGSITMKMKRRNI